MKISWQQLKNLPVYTEMGQKIGVVCGVEVDVDNHTVINYEIVTNRVLIIFIKHILIGNNSVVSITAKKMIVKDSVVPVKTKTTSTKTRLAFSTPKPKVEMMERGK